MEEKNIIPLSAKKKKFGRGNATNFWKDIWIANQPLFNAFTRVYRLDDNNQCTVLEKRSPRDWKWQWCRPLRGSEESSQFQQLLHKLLTITFSDSNDKRWWDLDLSNEFSIVIT